MKPIIAYSIGCLFGLLAATSILGNIVGLPFDWWLAYFLLVMGMILVVVDGR